MSAVVGNVEEVVTPLSERGPSPRNVIVAYGFWLFLLSDIVVFSALFAAYAVLANRTAGGPGGLQLFHRGNVLIETACLLFSSVTCALMALAIEVRRRDLMMLGAIGTFVLGAAFLALEIREFADLIDQGAGPQRSAFLSGFFALVGMHGVHVAIGLCWMVSMVAQVFTLGWRPMVVGRLACFSLFWHALDIVWIGVFHDRLPGSPLMDEREARQAQSDGRETPGDAPDSRSGFAKALMGLAASIVLTLASFWAAGTASVWGPGVPVLLAVLAIGQMGVHLVFFLHVSSGPEGTNNILALAFGVFVAGLLVFGSLVIMASLDAGMASMPSSMSLDGDSSTLPGDTAPCRSTCA